MEKNTKLILSALLITSAIFLTSTITLFLIQQATAQKKIELEEKVEDLEQEKAKLSKDLDEALVIKTGLEMKLSSLQDKANQLENQIEMERRERESVFSQLDGEKKESKRLLDELMRVKDEKDKITSDLASVRGECDSIKTQLSSVQQSKEVLENKLKELLVRNEVELERIVVKPEVNPEATNATAEEAAWPAEGGTPAAAPDAKGEILVVNKKFDFVVVSLGERNALMPGMNLGVYRNDKLIAMLVVEKVHSNMAAAKIPAEWKNTDLKEGDVVVVTK